MKVIKAPNTYVLDRPSVFLAGSIEMGHAVDWQRWFEDQFKEDDVILLNPRRDAWDSSLEQSINNPQFRTQVEWELNAQENVDVIAMYFAPGTKAPITLLELGLFAGNNLVVCCPEGFWRKGNVDIVCNKYKIMLVDSLPKLVQKIRRELDNGR